jgi:hypothetical protein
MILSESAGTSAVSRGPYPQAGNLEGPGKRARSRRPEAAAHFCGRERGERVCGKVGGVRRIGIKSTSAVSQT